MSTDFVVGIDLGTTNSCVAVFRNDQLEILHNQEGKYVTPSYVFIQKDQNNVVVGDHARRMAGNKPELGIYEIKRFMGRQFNEVVNVQNLDDLSFVVKNRSGKPEVFVEVYNKYYSPEEISALILRKIRNDTTQKLGQAVTKAVITVPAHFNVSQRKATLQAAETAGFTVLKLLSEPTAAALNYFYEVKDEDVDGKLFLVYDLGGGTFDVSIVQKQKQDINIIAVDGDSHLGGNDFDKLIIDHLLQKLKSKYNVDTKLDRRTMRRLKNESEIAKESLSTGNATPIILEGFQNLDAAEINITRKDFEEVADNLFRRTIAVVDRCLKNKGLAKDDIETIILAGGSTRIPKIQHMLKDYFNGKSLTKILHPEECVAKGAALQAAMLSQNPIQKLEHFTIKEVTSSSLGIGDLVNRMNFIIRKNTPTPTSNSETHATVSDRQKTIYFRVFEGERIDVRKNISLGTLEITNLTPAPPGKCRVTVTMKIDGNGILDITAHEKLSNNIRKLEIALVRDTKASSYRAGNERYSKEEDAKFAEFADSKEYLLNYCTAVKYNLTRLKLTDSYRHVFDRCRELRKEISQFELGDEPKLMALGAEAIENFRPLALQHKFMDMPNNPRIEQKFKKISVTATEASDEDEFAYGTVPVKQKKMFFRK